MPGETRYTLAEAGLEFARQLNGRTWALLELAERSPEQDEELVHTAHASLCHWLQAGTPLHHQRGAWLLAHVYTVLGDAPAALRFARRCLELTAAYQGLMADFDLAYAYEGLARALALAGETQAALENRQRAVDLGAAIANPEDRQIFTQDLHSGAWFGLPPLEADQA